MDSSNVHLISAVTWWNWTCKWRFGKRTKKIQCQLSVREHEKWKMVSFALPGILGLTFEVKDDQLCTLITI